METPYVGGVYFPTPLVILHPKEEEEGEATMCSNPSLPVGTPRWRKRLIGEDGEQEEVEEGFTMPHPPRRAS